MSQKGRKPFPTLLDLMALFQIFCPGFKTKKKQK